MDRRLPERYDPRMTKTTDLLLIAGLFAGAALSSCSLPALGRGGARSMTASPTVPAAQGTVKFGKAANDNTSIDLEVKHLADPEKLTPAAQVYVVWIAAPDGAPAQNIGALTVDKNLTGRLKTVSPLHRFELFITGETSRTPEKPTGEKLLSTGYSKDK